MTVMFSAAAAGIGASAFAALYFRPLCSGVPEKGKYRWVLPAVFACGLLFCVLGTALAPQRSLWREFAVVWALLICAAEDGRSRTVPLVCIAVPAAAGAETVLREAFFSAQAPCLPVAGLAGALLCFSVPAMAGLAVRGGIGRGDVLLLGALGLFFGIAEAYRLLLMTFLPCALCSAGLLLFRHKSCRETLPLVPFLAAGTLLCLALRVFGEGGGL